MVYGILLESVVRNYILEKYDKILLQQIEEYVQMSLSHLNLFDIYDDKLMFAIAEGRNKYSRLIVLRILNELSYFYFLNKTTSAFDVEINYLMRHMNAKEVR
jgi:hypothetical protein